MSEDLAADLTRERIVRDNLQARLGALMGENIELLVRIHELETAQQSVGDDTSAEAQPDD